jgi:UDP-N-acetyl-D-glucosamine/UDP-N-acetyl-D-galactosamine dehydrogenase
MDSMDTFRRIVDGEYKISITGLGYVGLPIAVAFARLVKVIGYDISPEKIKIYKNGIDPTEEVGDLTIRQSSVEFTNDESKLREAKFHIIAVPTPVNPDKSPNLRPVILASQTIGRNLSPGSVVVYESTVYPGVTEEICIPTIEKESGMQCGVDFTVGYSPERINPGDKNHRLENIVKVVSGYDEETLDLVAKVYELVVKAGVYRAESIKVAEAAKVIENSQRDINIAFMNELSIIFNKMGIDTSSVLQAARTKWNFLGFTPGLVGGHCIGVDPYYLTYKAEQFGYHSQVILSGRRINDSMGKYVAENIIKNIIKANIPVRDAAVAILGLTFKENCPDIRNTRVIDIINELKEYGITPVVADPHAKASEAQQEYSLNLVPMDQIKDMDAVVIAVGHQEFANISQKDFDRFFASKKNRARVIIDVKGILDKSVFESVGYRYWRL